ncbi:MAG: YceI family protein [Bacteroidales bacterium]
MKKTLYLFSVAVMAGMLMAGCGSPSGEKASAGDAQQTGDLKGEIYKADSALSLVEWEGSKPGGKHNGTIAVKSGEVSVDNGAITGGKIIIDMHSIVNLDIQDKEYNQKLVGHLKSADFFSVDSFPEAYFTIVAVKPLASAETLPTGETVTHEVTGNLKIKDIEKSISFKARVEVNENMVSASAPQFTIDRSEWKIKYGSRKFFDNLKDKFIYDEIGLKFTFVANK